MSIFEHLYGIGRTTDLKKIIEKGAFLVDVRTPSEFAQGHVKGSVNIPLDKIPAELAQFENRNNIIVFCLSGGRSTQAKLILEKNGFTGVINGGTWKQVNQFVK
ncbi:MAG TPA: rhodanese-like domain-containing protein [Puia sp.]|nr:rhodanese-like domain-containing protein [Puia sp.]